MSSFPNTEFNDALSNVMESVNSHKEALTSFGDSLSVIFRGMFPEAEEFEFVCIDVEGLQLNRGTMQETDILCTGYYSFDAEESNPNGGEAYVDVTLGAGSVTLGDDTVIIVVN